jgi:DNA-binding MarR family transcriptional regulator
MSVQAITSAFAVQGVSPSEKLLLLALANYADADGECWPSQTTLTFDTGLSERTIRTALASLESAGLLSRERRSRPNGSRTSDLITLTLPENIAARSDKPTGKLRQAYRQSSPNLPATAAPPTTFEPSEEPSVEPLEAAQAQPQAKPDPKGTRLPDEWTPQLSEVAFAKQQGMTLEEITLEADKFRDFWCAKPGAGGRKSDWSATWRNWCRNRRSSASVAGGARSGGYGQGPSDFASIIAERRGRSGV